MSTQSYYIPAQSHEHCYEVKKSRFIAQVHPVQSREEAMQWLEKTRQQYPDARHHCWAYLLGNPKSPANVAFSDDGEPSGTAGKPILNVLNHKDIGNILVIVIRYFGGIKLGAGGLVRAYSTATQQAIEQLPLVECVPMTELRMACDFASESELRRMLETIAAEIISCDYQNDIQLIVSCPKSVIRKLNTFCDGRQGVRLLSPYE